MCLSKPLGLLAHVGLVLSIARAFWWPHCVLSLDDLVQEGMLALCKAWPKYDPARGRPAPFLGRKIRWALTEAIVRELRQTARLEQQGNNFNGAADHRGAEQHVFELAEWLDVLTARERLVVEAWFGIGRAELSPREIGELLGLTRQRIWQIYAEAIDKMRECACGWQTE